MPTSIRFIAGASSDPTELAQLTLREVRTHGAVCLRGGVQSIAAASQLIASIPAKGLLHSGTRTGLRLPHQTVPEFMSVGLGTLPIFWHRERGYLPSPPDLLFLWCEKAPSQGGGTLLCDGREVARQLSDSLRRRLSETPIVWRIRLPYELLDLVIPEKTELTPGDIDFHLRAVRAALPHYEHLEWQLAAPDDKHAVDVQFQTPIVAPRSRWSPEPVVCNYVINGTRLPLKRRSSVVLPGFAAERQDRPWTLQGEPFPPDLVAEIEAHCNAVGVEHAWQDQDLLVIDNSRVMHARNELATDMPRIIWILMARLQGV